MNATTGKTPPLKWLFFSFKGRIARQSYILAQIFLLILQFFVIWQLVRAGEDENRLALWGLVYIALGALTIWAGLALVAKRLHDLDLPAALLIMLFIPPINWLFMIFLMAMPSSRKTNQHGPPPFQAAQSE